MLPIAGTTMNAAALQLINTATLIHAHGPVFNGPGADKSLQPFNLSVLDYQQRDAVERAKKYAMEQSIRAVLLRQSQTQQYQQISNIKKNQTVALLNRVYVGSISYEVKEENLRTSFSAFGPLKTVTMSWDPATQKHKGFAFLEFEYPEGAKLAIDQMNTMSFGGRQLKVGRPSNLTDADEIIADLVKEYKLENYVYVSGIHADLTEEDLVLVFEAFGTIICCRLLYDPAQPSKHRGFGYIEYQSPQSALDAVASMNQFNLGGQLLRVCKAISPPDGIANAPSSVLPPAAAVAAASVTAQLLSMETEQLPINTSMPQNDHPYPDDLHGMTSYSPPPQSTSPDQYSSYNGAAPKITYMYYHAEAPATNQLSDIHTNHALPDSFPPFNAHHTTSTTDRPPVSLPGVLILRNMVGPEDCDDDLEGEVMSECSRYGTVQRVLIHQQLDPITRSPIVKVFAQFVSVQSAENALDALNGRFFAGRQVTAELYDLNAFLNNNYSL